MRLEEVGAKKFGREVIRSNQPVLLHVRAAWCRQSRALEAVMERLGVELADQVKVVWADFENTKLMKRLGVTRVPTQMLFVDGRMVDQILGATTEASLRAMVKDGLAVHERGRTVDASLAGNDRIVDDNFGRRILQSEAPVLAVFWRASCAASVRLLDEVERAQAANKKSKMRIVPIDVDQAPATAARFQVTRLPTSLVFENGHVVDMLGGLLSAKSIGQVLDEHG